MQTETTFVVINHRNHTSEGFTTFKEAELNLDGKEFELRACYGDGSYEILIPQTYYKV